MRAVLALLLLIGCVPEGRPTLIPDPSDPKDPNDGEPGDGVDGDDTPPVDPNPDPNALRFERDILPILEAHCTECHDPGRAYDFTKLPLGPPGAAATVELILAAAASVMPPAPREKMSMGEIDKIRLWKEQGFLP